MTNNHSNVNVETKNNRVNKMITLNSIHLEIILHYITLTSYYIVKDTFRLQAVKAMKMWKQKKNNRVNKMTT